MTLDTQGYTVNISDQQLRPDGGVYWHGTIYCNSTPIGTCYNAGTGGQTIVEIPNLIMRAAYNDAAARACPKSYEAPNRFAERLADHADGVDHDDHG